MLTRGIGLGFVALGAAIVFAPSLARAEPGLLAGGGPGIEPPAAVSPEPPKAPARPALPDVTLNVDIDLANQRMTVSEGGLARYQWAISSGRRGYETPRGTFRGKWMARNWYSRQYDLAPMPHSVFFNGGIATHATSEVRRLGRPASHGCIRLAPANAATLYKMVGRHGVAATRFVVHGRPREAEPMVASRSDRSSRTAARERRRGRGDASAGYFWYGGPADYGRYADRRYRRY